MSQRNVFRAAFEGEAWPLRSACLPAAVLVAILPLLTFLAGAARADDHDDLPPSHSVTPELFATGFEFAEGPAFDQQGNLYVVNYRGIGNIGQITADGTARVICNLRERAPVEGASPAANGLKVDSEGRLIASDSGAGRLLRISEDGENVEVLADRHEGKRFDSVNDVALDRAGNIFFSDPGTSSAEEPTGSIYRFSIRTGKVSLLAANLAYPNGLGVTPDQRRLVVAESKRYRLLVYDLTSGGEVENGRVLIEFPTQTEGKIIGGHFEPDGLVFDARGRLYVGMWTGGVINVVDVERGELIRQYDAGGQKATNCHFFGQHLYTTVAAKEAVFRLKLDVKGFDYNGDE